MIRFEPLVPFLPIHVSTGVVLSDTVGFLREGTQPDAVTYNTMIKACDASWEYALDVLELMELDGMEPNMLCYTAAMGACIVGECYNEAINLYNEMLALGMVLDADALRTARYAHELAGNKEAARAIDEEMKERNLIPL